MATPANRVPVRVGRGTKANLDIALAAGDLKEGEVLFATDEDKFYVVDGGALQAASGENTISGLGDVNLTSIADSDILKWDNTNSEWINGSLEFGDLSNVDTDLAVSGKTIAYDGTNWVAADLGAAELTDLNDATIFSPSQGDIMIYNSTQQAFLNETHSLTKLSDVDPSGVADGNTLLWSASNSKWLPGFAAAGSIDALTDVDTTTNAPTNGQSLVWNSTNSEWVPGNAGGVSSVDDLSDVDTTTNAPTSGQVLAWDGTSNWVPTTGGGGVSTLQQMDDTDVPAVQTVERFSGRWNEDPVNGGPGATDWSRWDGTGFFYVRTDGDADGQDISAGAANVVEGDTLEIARDSGFTDVLHTAEITAIFNSSNSARYTLDPIAPASLDGEGALYIRAITQSVDIEDNEVLVYDLAAQKWVPGQPTIPNREIDDLINVASSPTVSLMNFDVKVGTGLEFEPFSDEAAKQSPNLQWGAKWDWSGVSDDQFKFGTASFYAGSSSSLMFPANSQHSEANYPLWAPQWALGDSDFTMELWWYHPTDANTSDRTFFSWNDGGGGAAYADIAMDYSHDGLEADSAIRVYYREDGAGLYDAATEVLCTLGTFIAYDTWHHIALCREGANLRAFLNGQQVGATHNIGTKVIRTPTYQFSESQFQLGNSPNQGSPARGYIDAWNYIKEAKYTANFSVPTEAPERLAPPDDSVLIYDSFNNKWESGSVPLVPADLRTALGIGEYVDDAAAGSGGVTTGALYYNTTSSDYRLKS